MRADLLSPGVKCRKRRSGWRYVLHCDHRSKSCESPPASNLLGTSRRWRRNAAIATKRRSQIDSMPQRQRFRAQPPSRSSAESRRELPRQPYWRCWRASTECKQKCKSRSLSLPMPHSAYCRQSPDTQLQKSTERRQARVLAVAAFARPGSDAFSCGA